MKIKGFMWQLLIIGVLCGAIGVPATANMGDSSALTGITSVHVAMSDLNQDAIDDGLDKDAILNEAIHRLSNAHINISDDGMGLKTVWLNIDIGTLKTGSIYAYSVYVAVTDVVKSVGRPSPAVLAIIWDRGSFGTVGSSKLTEIIPDVYTGVDQFIADYKTANPKPAK